MPRVCHNPGQRRGGRHGRAGQIAQSLFRSLSANKIAVCSGQDTLVIIHKSIRHSTAQPAARMADYTTCFDKGLNISRRNGILKYLVGSRHHDYPQVLRHFLSLHDFCRNPHVFQGAVGTASDINLIHLCTQDFTDRMHIVHPLWTGKLRFQSAYIIYQYLFINRVLIHLYPVNLI